MALDENVPLVSNQIATDLIAMNANWEVITAAIIAKVSDTVYGAGWDGVTTIAPSKNAVYDKIAAMDVITAAFSGTKMWFYQNVAPTYWTITAGIADVAIAVKGGAAAYNVNGGNLAGTWTQPDCTLGETHIPAHTHGAQTPAISLSLYVNDGATYNLGTSLAYYTSDSYRVLSTGQMSGPTQAAHTHTSFGGGTAHNHGTTYRPYAAVGIICTKD